MVHALTINEIEKYCGYNYPENEKRIVGIMIARYSNVLAQDMIKQQYDFWHIISGNDFNVYWLGYGAYYFPHEFGQYLVGDIGGEPSVFFDTNVFVQEVEILNQYIEIHDNIGLLLCNYYDEKIHLEESVFFDLEELMKDNNSRLRDFVYYLIELSKGKDDVAAVTIKLKRKHKYLVVRPTNWISTIIQTVLSVLSVFSLVSR